MKRGHASLLDAPGYGFASASRHRENAFKKMVKYYLLNSSRLCGIYWLSSLQHPLNQNDQVFFNFAKFCRVPITLVFTKADLFHKDEVFARVVAFSHVLRSFECLDPLVLITSSQTGFGVQDLKNHLLFRWVLLIHNPKLKHPALADPDAAPNSRPGVLLAGRSAPGGLKNAAPGQTDRARKGVPRAAALPR